VSGHVWLAGSSGANQQQADLAVDCHRWLRGPYSGLGSVLRALVPDAHRRRPGLVRKHSMELSSIAPELADLLDATPETLLSQASATERTRFYPLVRTRRLAQGAVDFLQSYLALAYSRPVTISFAHVDEADHTDQEFLALLLRRARPALLNVVVSTRGEDLPDELTSALRRYARRVDVVPLPPQEDPRGPDDLLRAYIDADGTSDDPAERAGYDAADPTLRAALHDGRAAELDRDGEWTLRLGAIPYHRERGGDPAGAGARAMREAVAHCSAMGFYHALMDYGLRGRELVDPDTQVDDYWYFSAKTATALTVTERPDEAEPLYLELRRRYSKPVLHMTTAYALAMLYTRYHSDEKKDHDLAKIYVNNAIALALQWPDLAERAFHTVFMENGLALVEMHLGNLPAALRLVSAGLDRLNSELTTGSYALHRSVLIHNRANALRGLGRLDESHAAFSAVIQLDPNWADYYFDRASVRRQLGEVDGALADYAKGMTVSPPFWELHYNRGDLLAELGDLAGAIADLSRVVELEPEELDSRINLVDLLLETGDLGNALQHVDLGLFLHPGNARLLHARGLLAQQAGAGERARRDFDLALAADPRLVPALVSRAVLAHERDDHDGAVADLTAAVEIDTENPDLLYNRGFVYQATGQWVAAVADYTRALELPDADQDELLHQLARCQTELAAAS
jgi:tetratricopeptide (TPR) repeat protein